MAVKVETERKPGSQVVLSVEVPVDQVSKSIEQAYSRLAPRVRIAGFRPGKAPRPMIERQIGWSALRQEALDQLLPTAYNAALDEAGLDPIDVPKVEVEQFDRDAPFRFKATVSIKPEVTLKDYKDIRVPKPQTEVTDTEVNEAIERLRLRFAELHEEVRDDLQEAAARADQQRFENDVLKALGDRVDVEIPEALIDREVNRNVRELELRLQEQGIRFDRYLQYTNSNVDVVRSERRPQALQKVRLELALEAVAEREGLNISDAEVDDAVRQALEEDQQLARKAEDLQTADPVRNYFRHQLLMRKTIDHLTAAASSEASDTMGARSDESEPQEPATTGGRRSKSRKER